MYRWYLSVAAMREFIAIAGFDDDDGGSQWGAAERELGALCDVARLAADEGRRQIWRTPVVSIGPSKRRTRLEFTVLAQRRPEGDLFPLVRVRDKGR